MERIGTGQEISSCLVVSQYKQVSYMRYGTWLDEMDIPNMAALREGCRTDEALDAGHHRGGPDGGHGPRVPGAVSGHRREPRAGPDRLPRSGPPHGDPRLEGLVLRGARGKLPAWPTSARDEAPSLVIGELHHPTVPRESERPSWLVIPEKGLYTGVLVVGAVGTGKTTACMYPFARQI